MAKVAIIFGATGIVGSAIAEELAKTSNQEWKKIIITSRRQPTLETKDERINFVSIDLEGLEVEEIKNKLKGVGAEEITHMFFAAYIHSKTWDGIELSKRNTPLFEKAVKAVDSVAPNLQRIVLQLGMKYYGIHMFPVRNFPIGETTPRHKKVESNPNFYYEQEDFLIEYKKGKKWTYTCTLPNHILGVTRGNGMSAAPTLALYFLVHKELGKTVKFPGTVNAYKGMCDTSNAELIAQFSILVSTKKEAENEIYNIIDHNSIHTTWEQQWKAFGDYFKVEVEGPGEKKFSVEEYMKDKKGAWESYVKKHGGDASLWDYATFDFIDAITGLDWENGPYDLSKAQKIGWKKELTSIESYYQVFDKLKRLNMIQV